MPEHGGSTLTTMVNAYTKCVKGVLPKRP